MKSQTHLQFAKMKTAVLFAGIIFLSLAVFRPLAFAGQFAIGKFVPIQSIVTGKKAQLQAPIELTSNELATKIQEQAARIDELNDLIAVQASQIGKIETKLDALTKENENLRKRLQGALNAPPSQPALPTSFPNKSEKLDESSEGNPSSIISPALFPYFVPVKPGENLYYLRGARSGGRLDKMTEQLKIWTGTRSDWRDEWQHQVPFRGFKDLD